MNRSFREAFLPPSRLLLGPGPSPVAPEVLSAMAGATIGHLDPAFIGLMAEIKTMLQMAFATSNEVTFAVAGPGSLGMDTCVLNLIEPGDSILIARNGVFGTRMCEVALRGGAKVIPLDFEWGTPVDAQAVDQALTNHPEVKFVGFVHAETSTGVASDAAAIAAVARKHGALTIMDAVTSLAGIPIKIDEWGIDAVYSGSQKCLSCPPGLSPVSFGPRAVEHVKARKSKVLSWFIDITQVMAYWGGDKARAYHHTAPVNSLYALHESLRRVHAEGIDAVFARHQSAHQHLVKNLGDMGIEMLVSKAHRLPQLNAIKIPEGINDALFRTTLLNEHNIEIGAGLGPLAGKIWRIGLMGEGARIEHVDRLLSAMRTVLSEQRGATLAMAS
jgi:alanine-glyoxylate transaminase / serine-glyoxylate transaminase / serine-pyruvate transaminase